MYLIPFHNAISLLLAAALLTNSVAVTHFSHIHAGGEECHSHGAEADHGHVGCHEGGHAHEGISAERDDDGNVTHLTTGPIPHAHVSLFGFMFSLPSSDKSGPNEDEPDELAALDDDPAIVPINHLVRCDDVRPGSPLSCPGDTIVQIPATKTLCAQVPTPPLCDRARFERSGVLLI